MLTFMLGVLGSVLFWIGYGVFALFAATISMRKCAPKTFKFVTTGKQTRGTWGDLNPDFFDAGGIVLFHILLWPLVALWFAVGWIFKMLIFKAMSNMFVFADKATNFSIVKNERE